MVVVLNGDASGGGWIKEGTIKSFYDDVLTASTRVPVIVDFWATWCGPCKTLGPALEKAVEAAKGAIHLVKIDVDRNPELAAQMRVQSVPAVYAFVDGRPVDGFVGAVPESQIKAFVQRLLKGADSGGVDEALAESKALLEAGQADEALELYRAVLAAEPDNLTAMAGVMRALLALGKTAAVEQMYAGLTAEQLKAAEIAAIGAALDLARQAAAAAGSAEALRRALAANENDHQARFDLAMAQFAAGDREGAVDQLLELFRRDRAWNDEAARKQLVKFFDAFGNGDPLTVKARKRLSSLMFA
jgi:putative thioredoxin